MVRRLADGLIGVADGFVGEALGFVLECTHGKSPWLERGSIASPPINERHSANVPWKRATPFTAKRNPAPYRALDQHRDRPRRVAVAPLAPAACQRDITPILDRKLPTARHATGLPKIVRAEC